MQQDKNEITLPRTSSIPIENGGYSCIHGKGTEGCIRRDALPPSRAVDGLLGSPEDGRLGCEGAGAVTGLAKFSKGSEDGEGSCTWASSWASCSPSSSISQPIPSVNTLLLKPRPFLFAYILIQRQAHLKKIKSNLRVKQTTPWLIFKR